MISVELPLVGDRRLEAIGTWLCRRAQRLRSRMALPAGGVRST